MNGIVDNWAEVHASTMGMLGAFHQSYNSVEEAQADKTRFEADQLASNEGATTVKETDSLMGSQEDKVMNKKEKVDE